MECFSLRTTGLIVASWKFHVLKTNRYDSVCFTNIQFPQQLSANSYPRNDVSKTNISPTSEAIRGLIC